MSPQPRVLVVEDEPTDNQCLTLTVRGLGHAAEACFDGQAAIAFVQQEKPALVLLDALLPKADGFTVLQEIRKLHPDVPVYMMSGIYKKKAYEQEAVGKLGATAYLHKPLGVLKVWEILERHLPPAPPGEVSAEFPGVPFWRRPLPAVVADLYAGAKTGLLFVRGTGGSAILFFESGRIVFGRCNDPQLRLDRVLLQLGKLRPDQAPRVAQIVAQARGRAGDALVAEKLISDQDLCEALSLQQRNHVTRPLTWSEGSCWFHPSEAPRHETFKLQLDVPSLVFWAFRNLEVDDALIRFLPRPGRSIQLLRPAEDLARPFGLSPEEVRLLELADGRRTVGQVRAIGRMMQLDVDRILAGLVSLQLVEIGPETEAAARSAALMGASVPVAGDLARYSPTMLVVSMALGQKTGVLQLESVGGAGVSVQRAVHFENGLVAFATSSDPADRIGQVLLRVGLLTREQLQEALAAAQSMPGVPLGRVLVDRGMLRPDDLHAALLHQAQLVITGLVGWQSGTFRFQENDGPGRDIVPLGLDTRQALMAALRTCPFTDIAPRLPPPESRLRVTATAHQLAADLPLTALEQRLRDGADGSRTVQQMAQEAPEGPEAVLRAVFALTTIGLVEGFVLPAGASAPPPREAPAPAPARPHPVSLAASLDADWDAGDPSPGETTGAMTGETTGERARRARVLIEDDGFAAPDLSEDTLSPVAEVWSAGEEASFADVTAGLATKAASAADGWPQPQGPPAAESRPVEDWSAPDDASFAGLEDAVAEAVGDLGFALDALGAGPDAMLPLDGGDVRRALVPEAPPRQPAPARGGAGAASPATGTAVAAPPWTDAERAALEEFLARLGAWLRICPDSVPETVRNCLPEEIRRSFGL